MQVFKVGIRIDFSITKNGKKLNELEQYEIERKINMLLGECIDGVIRDALPSYLKYDGCSHKLVGFREQIKKVMG
jgi:hypothetical protein